MAVVQIPPHTTLQDGQFVQVAGPDGISTGYHYDEQQRALYFKESQVLYPSKHGPTHIAEDPVPAATCDTPGLMSADDKCKLDAFIGTRLGVLGFQGAGFPDDGGWMQGDIILAAGTDFISLERIGNVIRFTVDSPVPLNCDCEECQQIFWVQDETDVNAIRPPTCGGKLPGVNAYGEMKIYLFPESTIADPNNVAATIQNKGIYPAIIFKRYDDTIVPGAGEFELILKRDSNNSLQTEIGWAFTPGATGVPENVFFMGKDDDGNQIRFDLEVETTPGLLGSVLFNGHLITKRMGVITSYTSTVLSTNQYNIRLWDVDSNKAIGDTFTAQNVWQYTNPENPQSGSNPQALVLDATIDLLPIGTLVNLWAFEVGEIAGEPILRYYFREKPHLNPAKMWTWVGRQQFGDVVIAREETNTSSSNTANDIDDSVQVSAARGLTTSQWGLTGIDDPLLDFDIVSTEGTENADLSTNHRAVIDTSLPGLAVVSSEEDALSVFSERPVWLWNRHTLCNKIVRVDMGRPSSSDFVPYDIIFRGNIDEFTNIYMKVIEIGQIDSLNYIKIIGANFQDLPAFGSVRIISKNSPNVDNKNLVFNYTRKMISPTDSSNAIILASDDINNLPYPGQINDVVELLHQEYTSPVVRVEFSYNPSTALVEVQFKVGILDMSVPYEEDLPDDVDDYVRGLQAGYTVSAIYSQAGTYTGVGAQPDSSVDGFVVYDGGMQVGGEQEEYWNRLEIMVRDDQVWLWWNKLLIPPSTIASAQLPTPVAVETPYFPTDNDSLTRFGKFGMRMWPGATIRRADVRTQLTLFNEFSYGQLEVV
jgi:hypothetical protein